MAYIIVSSFLPLFVYKHYIQNETSIIIIIINFYIQGGSNMTGADLCVKKPQCAAAVRP